MKHFKLWLKSYKQAKEQKAKEAKYLASSMCRTNNIMRRW